MAFETFNVKAILQGSVTGTDQFDRFGTKLNSIGKTADNVNKQMAGLQSTIRGLAAAFGAAQLAQTAAEFARVTIQIDAFQKQLSIGFGDYGVIELEKLRDTMRQLGISQDEALGSAVRFTSALKLSGQSMAETNKNFEAASKLILSNKLSADGANRVYYAMAQIASKGKLMSEELSGQLAENLAGIREQVAAAMGKSSAQLLDEMSKGKVTAQEFFDALQKIGGAIDPAKLDSAAMSLGKMKNAWYDFKTSVIDVGVIKSALDLTTSAILILKDNAQLLSAAVQGLAVAFAGVYAARLLAPVFGAIALATRVVAFEFGAAAAFMRAFGVSATMSAVASMTLSRSLGVLGAVSNGVFALFGGPIGVALTAVAAGFYAVYSTSSAAEEGLLGNAQAAKELGIQLSAASQQALIAANENRGVGSAAASAEPQIWSYKNSVDNLTVSQYELAKASREARLELAEQRLEKAVERRQTALDATPAGRQQLRSGMFTALGQGDFIKAFSLDMRNLQSGAASLLSGRRTDREGQRNLADANLIVNTLKAQIATLRGTPVGRADLPAGSRAPVAPATTATGGRSRAPTGPSPVQIEKTFENMRDDYTQATLKAQRDLTNTIEARYQNQLDALSSDISAKASDVAAAKGLSDAQRETLTTALANLTAAKLALLNAQKADETARQANAIVEISASTDLEILKMQESMAGTAAERKEIQKRILAAEIALQLAKEDEVINSQTASAEEKALARARREGIIRAGDVQGRQIDQQNRGPVEAYAATLTDTATQFQQAWAGALKSTEDAFVNFAMTGKLSFRDLANSIISDMIRIAIQQAIIKPLMASFGFTFADGGVFQNGSVTPFAKGGVVNSPTMFPMSRGMGLMGEAGPEAIMPLRRLGNGRLGVESTGGGTQNVSVTVNVEGGQSKVQGDAGKAGQLGQVVAQAVRNELVVQKRPGGLLAAA